MDREMQKALELDGEKLRQLTGEDHGPYFAEEPSPYLERTKVLTAALQKVRWALAGAQAQGYPVADWQLRMWIGDIDKLKASESPEERKQRVRHTPCLAIAEDEIDLLDDPQWVRDAQAKAKRITECPGHERVSTSTREESNRGWHKGHCRHCDKDMSYDSGD